MHGQLRNVFCVENQGAGCKSGLTNSSRVCILVTMLSIATISHCYRWKEVGTEQGEKKHAISGVFF